MLEAGIKTVGGGLTYAAGWVLQIKGVGVTIASVGGFSALGVGLVVGGEALKVAGGFSAATGIEDFRLAASVPDGIDANAFGNLSYEVAQGAGIEGTKLEIVGLTEDILTGGINIGKLAVDGRALKLIEALINTAQITGDLRNNIIERGKQIQEIIEKNEQSDQLEEDDEEEN